MYYRINFLNLCKPMNVILPEDQQNGNGALWLGNYMAAIDKQTLQQKNIKTVLTCALELNVSYDSSFTHHKYMMNDIETYRISIHFDATNKAIEEGLKKGSVLVHCAAGVSRSATVVIAYLMKNHGMSLQKALNFCRSKRKIVNPNYGFINQLKAYERKLIKEKEDLQKASTNLNAQFAKLGIEQQQQANNNKLQSGEEEKVASSAQNQQNNEKSANQNNLLLISALSQEANKANTNTSAKKIINNTFNASSKNYHFSKPQTKDGQNDQLVVGNNLLKDNKRQLSVQKNANQKVENVYTTYKKDFANRNGAIKHL